MTAGFMSGAYERVQRREGQSDGEEGRVDGGFSGAYPGSQGSARGRWQAPTLRSMFRKNSQRKNFQGLARWTRF